MTKSPYRILFIDDDRDSRDLLAVWLKLDGSLYEIITASSVEEGRVLTEESPFDLYIVDYAMPEVSGIEFCLMIRSKDKETPIIVYSAMGRDIDRKNAMDAGANIFLIKPNDFDMIRPIIRALLEEKSQSPPPVRRRAHRASSIL